MRKMYIFALLCVFATSLQAAPSNIPQLNPGSQLQQLAQTVLLEHPDLQAARAEYNAALAQMRAADQPLYNPELEIDIEKTDIKTSSLGINQAIDWSDKRGAQATAGQARAKAALAQLRQTQINVLSELLNQLSQYHHAGAQASLAKQRVELLNNFYQLARQRFEAGDVGRSDVDLARMALSEAQMQSASAVSDAYAASTTLLTYSSKPADGWPQLPALPQPWDGIKDPEALKNHPLLQQSLWQFRASQSQLELARRQSHADPTIGLRGGKEADESLLGFSFSMPLNFRNTFKAEIEAAAAESLSAEQNWIQARRLASARLESASQRYQLTYAALQDWQSAGLASLKGQTQLLKRLWESGELSTTEYLVQLQQTLDTRSSAIELQQSAWDAWTDWLKAAGQLHHWLAISNKA